MHVHIESEAKCAQGPHSKKRQKKKDEDASGEDSDGDDAPLHGMHMQCALSIHDKRGRSAAHIVCNNKHATTDLLAFVLGKEFIPMVRETTCLWCRHDVVLLTYSIAYLKQPW